MNRDLLTLACAVVLLSGRSHQAGVGQTDDFDFLMLVREWPFTFCTVNSCSHKELLQAKFNIHGLWAESASGRARDIPMFCNTTFNYSELTPLLDELNQNWMNLKNPNGTAKYFWQEEFVKHGSCVATEARFNSTYLYFKGALDLHTKYNLLDMLVKGGVAPGSDLINSSTIREVLQSSFGSKAGVRCFNKDGTVYLYELRLCFTKDLGPTDCDEKESGVRAPLLPSAVSEAPTRGLRWFLGRVFEVAKRLFWGPRQDAEAAGGGSRRDGQRRSGPSGTYACHEGEMVLLPATV